MIIKHLLKQFQWINKVSKSVKTWNGIRLTIVDKVMAQGCAKYPWNLIQSVIHFDSIRKKNWISLALHSKTKNNIEYPLSRENHKY